MERFHDGRRDDFVILAAWRKLLREAAKRPWLAGLLARRGTDILRRFAQFYKILRRRLHARARRGLATPLLGAALLFALGQARPVQAATIHVDGASCTLADAITAANTDELVGGCGPGDGADTIELQTDVTLTAPLPIIDSDLTLNANGHTIDGASAVEHVLHVTDATFELNEATITGGLAAVTAGGGLYSYYGTVTINRSTFTDNSAVYGGGAILNFYGNMTINNSTISGNNGPVGGGVANLDIMTLNNVTITQNSGVFGGGLYSGPFSHTTLNRTIISGNEGNASLGHEINRDTVATITAGNYNVIGYSGSERSFNFVKGATDVTPNSGLSSLLELSLQDNGGPTLTHALVSGSAAIDLAPDGDCLGAPLGGLDQRAFSRNEDGNGVVSANECDAGAVELGGAPTAVTLRGLSAEGEARGGLAALGALALGLATAGYRRLSHKGRARVRPG